MKIGVIGGAFNPPHNAHLRMGEYALANIGLDKVFFVPTYSPVHKNIAQAIPFEIRSFLIKLSIFEILPQFLHSFKDLLIEYSVDWQRFVEEYERLYHFCDQYQVLDIEKNLGGNSYTYNTIKELKKNFPQEEFHLIIGADQGSVFNTWKNWMDIPNLCKIDCFYRPGYSLDKIKNDYPFIETFNFDVYPISSEAIRNQRIYDSVPEVIRHLVRFIYQ